MSFSHNHRNDFLQQRWWRAQNKSTDIISPYSLLAITSIDMAADGSVVFGVELPKEDSARVLVVAGKQSIEPDGYGSVTQDWFAVAWSDEQLDPGDEVGTVTDSPYAKSGQTGLIVVGGPFTNPKTQQLYYLVEKPGGGGASEFTVATAATDLTARSGNVAGKGWVQPVKLDEADDTYKPEGGTVEIYNPFRALIPAGIYIEYTRDRFGTLELVTVDCVEDEQLSPLATPYRRTTGDNMTAADGTLVFE